MSEPIKNCPFCGGGAAVLKPNTYDFIVMCEACGCRTKYCKQKKEAVKIWNRRQAD